MIRSLINKIYVCSLVLLVVTGCNDILEVDEQTAIDGEKVFDDASLAELYLNSIYGSVLPGFSGTSNVGLTDESVGGGDLIYGLQQNPTTANPDETPGPYSVATYAKIRNVNLFLQQMEMGGIPEAQKRPLMGQAYFLRAWLYWDLVLHYGGVPITVVPLDNNRDSEADNLPRRSAAESVDQIVADLDRAMELIEEYSLEDYGRVTKAAAAAFKGRVLLFYASPQFDPNGMNSADGIPQRWEAAYEANLEAKQIAEAAGHALFPDFSNVFIVEEGNPEPILVRKYSQGLLTHGYENNVRPESVNNSGTPSATPAWDLVKSFPMRNGLSIDATGSEYDPEVYWKDRDPRFYATIGYNSIPWKFADREDPRQWTYVGNAQENNVIPRNGFYLKKNINPNIANTQTVNTPTDWIEIRFAEVLLNLAESANETGRQDEALAELYAIRERAGIEPGGGNYGIPAGLSKAELRSVIMNERKIELAFENKRYWDLRRRNLYVNGIDGVQGAGLNGTKRQRIITTLNTDYIIANNAGISQANDPADSAFRYFEAQLIHQVNWDDPANYENYFITTVEDAETLEINYLQPKYNFFYLPLNALVRNPNLEQTINWADGTFDPLKE